VRLLDGQNNVAGPDGGARIEPQIPVTYGASTPRGAYTQLLKKGVGSAHCAATLFRFHQPPPSAWNNAIVSP
jgi:hypothetical protein